MTYKKDLLMRHGFTASMNDKFRYARHMVKKLQTGPTAGRQTKVFTRGKLGVGTFSVARIAEFIF